MPGLIQIVCAIKLSHCELAEASTNFFFQSSYLGQKKVQDMSYCCGNATDEACVLDGSHKECCCIVITLDGEAFCSKIET